MAGLTQTIAEMAGMIYSEINILPCVGSQPSSAFLVDWNCSPSVLSEEGTKAVILGRKVTGEEEEPLSLGGYMRLEGGTKMA